MQESQRCLKSNLESRLSRKGGRFSTPTPPKLVRVKLHLMPPISKKYIFFLKIPGVKVDPDHSRSNKFEVRASTSLGSSDTFVMALSFMIDSTSHMRLIKVSSTRACSLSSSHQKCLAKVVTYGR